MVKASGAVVGHVPYNLPPVVFYFLTRDFNKDIVEVIEGEERFRFAGWRSKCETYS